MSPDSLPPFLWVPAVLIAWVGYIAVEFRASQRFWAVRGASDPVVVTGSGHRSNRYPRSCGGVR